MSKKGILIGQGRTAEVYAWGEGHILKLYRIGFPIDWAAYEFETAAAVQATGAEAPSVIERVQVEGREGIVYERVNGPTLLSRLSSKPWAPGEIGVVLADLQTRMHQLPVTGLPSQREKLKAEIQRAEVLSAGMRDRVLELVEGLPDDNKLCHGDFHPDNVLLTANGPMVIDWVTATAGHPLVDVARSSLLLTMSALPPGMKGKWLIHLLRQRINRGYLQRYGITESQLLPWKLASAAARLHEKLPPEELQALHQFVEAELREVQV